MVTAVTARDPAKLDQESMDGGVQMSSTHVLLAIFFALGLLSTALTFGG